MRSHHDTESAIHRRKSKLPLLMAGLFLILVETTVTVRAQERRHFTSSEFSHPVPGLSIHEMAQRYGISEAVDLSFQLEEQEDARREMERLMRAQRRDRELREKIAELARTSIKLYQRFDDPSETHADTPQLAKKCEELAKAIKKLLR
jgi:siroheme synthase (precorrin-2 oxidase/ferrochelatase)